MAKSTPLVVLGLLAAIACRGPNEPRVAEKPPVILISIDTLRADRLPAYGSKRIETPAIDRLAADGIVFENAYAHVPLTLPSHVTMLTGQLPWKNGVRDNIGYKLDPATPSLPKLLAGRGYATGAAVSAYVLRGETGLSSLFDAYDDSLEVYEAATLGELQRPGHFTVGASQRWLDTVRDRPPFLFVHLFEPHSPYEAPEPFRSRYPDPYDAEVAWVDGIVKDLLEALRQRDLYDRAMIVLTSDHGEGLGDHGEEEHGVLLYREALHVPLIVKLPQRRDAGKRVAAPAQLVDLLPTIASVAGAAIPAGLPGTSLLELKDDRAIYSETLYPRLHLGWSELRSLTDARHHYIESPDAELFDVVSDPSEKRNVREDERRKFRALADALRSTPLNLAAPGAASAEEMARLSALGYLSAGAPDDGPRRNPRDHIGVLKRVQETFALNEQGRYRESADLSRAILREYPELVDVYTHLAGNLRRLGRLREARDTYRDAIRRSPQLVDSLAIEVAKVELDLGDLDAASLNAQQALRLNPIEANLVLAAVSMRRGKLDEAEKQARIALGDEGRPRVPALILLAQILAEQKRFDEALAAMERASRRVSEERARNVPTLASTRGDILARMGRYAEAESAFREEIARYPTTTEAYVRLALLQASQRRFKEIGPTLEAMVKASPTPAAYELAARAMSDFGNEAAAREFRRRGGRIH